jgi:hypothetical protein
MDKHDIHKLIIDNKFKIFNSSKKDEKLKIFLEKLNIELPVIITVKNVYDYLIESHEIQKYCPVCGNENRFIGYIPGYTKFCSKQCLYKWRSLKMQGINNNVHKMTPEALIKMGKKNSKHIKERILNGTFTPNITNSWCHSKIEVNILQNNINKTIKCRSSWDAFFQLKNQQCLYEKIRIPYFYKDNFHIFIIDFVDIEKKIIYEIKPNSEILQEKNKIKFSAAKKWAADNCFIFKIINETWFKNNFNENLLIGQIEEKRLKKLLKQFNEN